MPNLVRDLSNVLDRMIELPRLLTRNEYDAVCADLDHLTNSGGRLAGYLHASRALNDREPRRELGERYRDSKGIPVIPGLDEAAYAFDDLWRETQKRAFDDACSKCSALFALGRAHPALAPEMRLLSELVMLHNEFCARLDFLPPELSAAEKRFFGFMETARSLTLTQACNAFTEMADEAPSTPRAEMMSSLVRRIATIVDELRRNLVSERLEKM